MRCIEDCVVQRVGGIEKIETLRSMFIGLVGRRARRQASSSDTLNVTVLCGWVVYAKIHMSSAFLEAKLF